jgi:NodT family efflux transporter outer membrane factor (OMF) lipoprotein
MTETLGAGISSQHLTETRMISLPSLSTTALAYLLLLSGCGLLPKVGPDYRPVATDAPAAWQAALPHGGDGAALAGWWRQWNDPLLVDLIAAAEANSPTLPQAWARIQQARAEAVAAGTGDKPNLDASLDLSRAELAVAGPVMHQTSRQAGLMSNWEIDLFGGIARRKEAAMANLQASRGHWHEARVSLAAETALALFQARFLDRRLELAQADLNSRRETARLTRTLADAGLQTGEAAALAEAGAAEATASRIGLRADYDQQIKALVALSAMAEPELRARLAAGGTHDLDPARFRIASLPAQVLAQRPDVAAAERDVAAASAAIGQAESTRYPSLQLSGALTPLRMTTDGVAVSATTWSLGAGLAMPLVDGGRIDANVDAAQAKYAAAMAAYRQKVRDAVREVEQALTRLDAADRREGELRRAAEGYRVGLAATRGRHQAGLAGPLELEEASRLALAAEISLAAWQNEQASAWVHLYRAAGGGWTPATADPAAPRVTEDKTGNRS